MSFVNDLGSMSRLVVVDALSLTNLSSAAVPGAPVAASEISATINARAFTTAEPPPAPGAPVAPTTTTAKGASGGAAAATPVTTVAGATAGAKTPAP